MYASRLSVPLCLLAITTPAFAQGPLATTVSPVTAATVEGNSNNVFPFASTVVRRYQQGHGDIAGSPKIISKLSFRVNAPTTATTFTGTAAIDMELFMSNTRPINQMSFVFANNPVGPITTVIARKIVNMGPQGMASPPGPNPFTANMDLVLDTPYPYPGALPLLWEAVVYSNTIAGTFSGLDVDTTNYTSGVSTITGTGCTATGRTAAMTHTGNFVDAGGTLLVNFTVTNGPSSAPAILALGATNPNLAIPGLCSSLFTDVIVLLSLGATDAAGAITTAEPNGRTFVLPNTLAGAVITSQVHCVDTGRTDPIPVSNSNGRSVTVPTSNTAKTVDCFRLTNNAGGTTATQGVFFGTSNIGHSLVTEFTH
jgi:hypothetical protein